MATLAAALVGCCFPVGNALGQISSPAASPAPFPPSPDQPRDGDRWQPATPSGETLDEAWRIALANDRAANNLEMVGAAYNRALGRNLTDAVHIVEL